MLLAGRITSLIAIMLIVGGILYVMISGPINIGKLCLIGNGVYALVFFAGRECESKEFYIAVTVFSVI